MSVLSALASAALCAVVAGAERSVIPIHAWMGPPAHATNAARYDELADAGFTHSFSHFPNRDAMREGLDTAHRHGISLFVACPELKTDPELTALLFKDHPALAGYHLRDEPSAADFGELARWVERVRSVDDEHFCYINLFPTYASDEQLGTATYQEHVDRFVREVPVQVISFDHYPVESRGDKTSLTPSYYENLTIIADAAAAAGKPFWAFTMALNFGPYPVPELSHMRLQVFSNLCYGAQGIQYFTFWTPDLEAFQHASLTAAGERTVVYDRVRQLNGEIAGLSRVFAGSEVIQVGHLGAPLPQGAKTFTAPPRFVRIDTQGRPALASHLQNDGRDFLAVVNPDPVKPLRVHLEFVPGMALVRKDGVYEELDGPYIGVTLEAGDIVVLTWVDAPATPGRAMRRGR